MTPTARRVIMVACFPLLSAAGSINLQGPATDPSIGEIFTIDVNVSGISDLYAFQFDLTFDPTRLFAVSVAEGGFLPSGGTTFFIPGTIDDVGGAVSATADSLIGSIPGLIGDGVLAEFQFTALAPGTSSLSFANEILLDSSLNDITANTTFQNGSITINDVTAVPEPNSFPLLCTGLVALIATREWHRKRGAR
jgi:hypothetical protein